MRLLAILAVLAIALLSPATPAAATAGPISVVGTNRGASLTLTISRRTYPWNALVEVSVRLENVSNRAVWVQPEWNTEPGRAEPQPEVRDRRGRLLFPPAFPYSYPKLGHAPSASLLRPRQVITGQEYVILRAPYLRLIVDLSIAGSYFTVATRTITLQLRSLPGPAYTVDVQRPPERLSATVTPVLAGPNGRLLHIEYSDCAGYSNWTFITWTAGGRHFQPDCVRPREWHVIAGYLGQPVVTIDWQGA